MSKPIRTIVLVAALAAAAPVIGGTAEAHVWRHRRASVPAVPAAPAPLRPTHSFYPESIEGGVSGNLPFNNQLRKLSDPLNANGGR